MLGQKCKEILTIPSFIGKEKAKHEGNTSQSDQEDAMNFKMGNVTTGIAFGIGFMVAAPIAAKLLSGVGRPLLKEAVKGGMYVYDQGRTLLAEAKESLEDLSAEARSELSHSEQLPAKAQE